MSDRSDDSYVILKRDFLPPLCLFIFFKYNYFNEIEYHLNFSAFNYHPYIICMWGFLCEFYRIKDRSTQIFKIKFSNIKIILVFSIYYTKKIHSERCQFFVRFGSIERLMKWFGLYWFKFYAFLHYSGMIVLASHLKNLKFTLIYMELCTMEIPRKALRVIETPV